MSLAKKIKYIKNLNDILFVLDFFELWYASLYFVIGIESDDNELIALEVVHRYVESLDKYFGNVCELDIIFNFEKAYYILDELIIGGEIQETSKKKVLAAVQAQDSLQEDSEIKQALEEMGLL